MEAWQVVLLCIAFPVYCMVCAVIIHVIAEATRHARDTSPIWGRVIGRSKR